MAQKKKVVKKKPRYFLVDEYDDGVNGKEVMNEEDLRERISDGDLNSDAVIFEITITTKYILRNSNPKTPLEELLTKTK